jgi:CRP-like cAMP-binding protein
MAKKIKDPHCLCCREAYSSYFAALSPEDLNLIQGKKEVLHFKKGTKIFLEGGKANGIFCLRSGHVKIFKNGSDGREQITRISFAGEFIGLKALLTGATYTVSAQAMDDVMICFITKQDFFELTIKYPEFTQALIFSLSKQLVDAELKMVSLAHKPVKERLADALLFLYQQFSVGPNGFEHPYLNLTRLDLANIIGTAQETVIRLLGEWKEEGILAIKGRKIFILNETRLQNIANSIS